MARLSNDVRQWAFKGAEQRLTEINQEAAAIYAAFPELQRRQAGAARAAAATGGDSPSRDGRHHSPRRRRVTISAEGRRRISEAQKARWAKRKDATAAPESSASEGRQSAEGAAKASGPKARSRRRASGAAGRKKR